MLFSNAQPTRVTERTIRREPKRGKEREDSEPNYYLKNIVKHYVNKENNNHMSTLVIVGYNDMTRGNPALRQHVITRVLRTI